MEGQLLAIAEEEAQEVGSIKQVGRLQEVVGRRPCHCCASRRCNGVKGAKHQLAVDPTHDPAADPVGGAEMSSR